MKRDKAWLQEEVNEIKKLISDAWGAAIIAGNRHFEIKNGSEMQIVKRISDLIDQLDEPEVLPQEWIDENKVARIDDLRKMTTSDVVTVEKLKNLIVPKQEKPVIPQFVADWYEENLSGGYTGNRNKFSGNDVFRVIQDVLKVSEGLDTWGDYGIDKKIATWAEENEEDFIHLIANCSYKDGYTVEKVQRWVVKVGKGYFSGYDETKVTYALDNFPGEIAQRIVYDNLNEAESDANDIGGEVEEVTK